LPSIAHTGDLNAGLFFPAADTVAVSTAGVERLRVDSSGQVGIGVTPTALLNLYSSTAAQILMDGDTTSVINLIRSSTNNGSPTFNFRKARGTTASKVAVSSNDFTGQIAFSAYDGSDFIATGEMRGRVETFTGVGDVSGLLTFSTRPTGAASVNTERMRIDSTGNVGIGTSSPGSKLDVVGTSATDIFHVRNGTTYFTVGVTSGGASAINAFQTAVGVQQLQLQTTGGTSYFGGNVGIGTTSPQAKLDIGDTSAAFTASIIRASATGIAELRFADTVDNAGYVSYDHTSNYMRFATSATERMRIDSSGVVAIGATSSLAYKLDIASSDTTAGIGYAVRLRANATAGAAAIQFTDAAASSEYGVIACTSAGQIKLNSTTVLVSSLGGTGSRTVTAGATGILAATSDSRLKQEVPEASIAGLAEIMQLRPVAYKWLDDIEKRGDDAAVELGFFANEAKDIIPSAAPMGNDGYYGFYDRAVIAALTKGMQEQQAIITALTARIAALEA
jgi:hypothetical protein